MTDDDKTPHLVTRNRRVVYLRPNNAPKLFDRKGPGGYDLSEDEAIRLVP